MTGRGGHSIDRFFLQSRRGRACTVRELASDSQEPERCPERSLRRARAQFQRMFMDHLSLDFDDGDYLDEKFGKLSACAVDSVELESRTEWVARLIGAQ